MDGVWKTEFNIINICLLTHQGDESVNKTTGSFIALLLDELPAKGWALNLEPAINIVKKTHNAERKIHFVVYMISLRKVDPTINFGISDYRLVENIVTQFNTQDC